MGAEVCAPGKRESRTTLILERRQPSERTSMQNSTFEIMAAEPDSEDAAILIQALDADMVCIDRPDTSIFRRSASTSVIR